MTRFYLLVLALLFNSLLTVAQSGANDPDFNTQDKGLRYGDGLNGSVSAIAVQSDGKIILGGTFTNYNGKECRRIARVNADGTSDETFNPGSGANAEITKVKVQSDGKILICGYFSLYNGKNANYLARLNADGSLDESFNFGTGANGLILAIDIQADGKIIIGGQFKTFNGVSRSLLTRLNSDGSSDNTFNIGTGVGGTDPELLNSVFSISAQSDGKILIGGRFSLFNGVVRNRIARLNSNGSLDSSFDPGNGPSDLVRDFLTQPDGKIIITGNFESYNGVVRAYIARIDGNGILDQTFNPDEGANELIFSSALRTDGKIVIGGNFTSYYGASRSRIAFVNTNGSVNDQFNPGSGFNNAVSAVATQADGKILVGGNFTSFNGKTSPYLDRMNPDGSVDLSFRVIGTGANNGDVAASDMQTDGRIVIGGSFSNYNGAISNKVARLKTDGTLDNTFTVGDGPNGAVTSVKVLPNGKILIGGAFLTFNGADRKRIVRLNADGGIDNTFSLSAGTNGTVTSIVRQTDNKFLIGGLFNTCNGVSRNCIARLNEDGSLDGTFIPGTGPNNYIYSVSIQTDGKILIGGRFTTYNGIARRGIARLNTNGTLDETFNPGAGIIGQLGNVNSIAIHPDGKIYIAGEFYTYNGSPRSCLARLNANGTLDDSFKSTSLVLQSGSANVTLYAISLLADGKILIGGNFSSYEGIARKALARLNADGTLDTSFDTGLGANGIIQTLSIQSDDKVVIGGNFSSYAGIGRNKIARVLKECSGPVTADIAELSSSASVICPGALTTLNVTAGNLSNAAQWKWYSGSCGGTLVGTGASVQVSPTSTTTYYVRAEGGCVSIGNCSSIVITTSSPSIAATPASRCGEGELKLTVTTAATTSVAWFTSPTGGEAIGSGNSFTTPSVYETTTYYAEATSNGCTAPRVDVVATVKSLPFVNVTLSGSTISVVENLNNATYQWINCANQQPLKGETKKEYSVSEIGDYAVTVTVDGCEAISDCVKALVTGVDEQAKEELRIYPNPVKDIVFIDLGDVYSRLEIMDMNGKLIYERSDVKGVQPINLNEYSGVYIVAVFTNSNVKHFKIVIE